MEERWCPATYVWNPPQNATDFYITTSGNWGTTDTWATINQAGNILKFDSTNTHYAFLVPRGGNVNVLADVDATATYSGNLNVGEGVPSISMAVSTFSVVVGGSICMTATPLHISTTPRFRVGQSRP
jgi:hypothetical protein